MHSLTYSLTNYSEIASIIAKQFSLIENQNFYSIPEKYGNGNIRHFTFEHFSVMITNFSFKERLRIIRNESDLRNYLDFGFVIKGISRAFSTDYENNFNRMGYGAYISTPCTKSESILDANTHHEQLFIMVDMDWLSEFINVKIPTLLERTDKELLIYTPLHQHLIPVIYQIYNHQLSNGLYKNYVYSKCIELLTLFFSYFDEKNYPVGFPEYHPEDLKTVVEIGVYLQQNITNTISIIELSNQFSINRDKMQKLFKAVHGTTIGEFQRGQRMAFAFNKIKEGHRVSEIGMSLGYSNLSHFARAFKKVHGFNPSELKSI